MTEPAGFDIRYTVFEDEVYLRKWLSSEKMLHYFPMGDQKEVDEMIPSWIGFAKWNCSLTGMIEGVPVAIGTLFLMPYRKVAHHCMFYLIVDPAWQKKGIGFSLMKNLKHLAKDYFRLKMMHLDVWEDNEEGLRLLYKSGFKEITKQEKFVKENDRYLARILMNVYL